MMGPYGMAPGSGDYGGDYSGDFSQLSLSGACLSPLSWSPYGAYPIYPGERPWDTALGPHLLMARV